MSEDIRENIDSEETVDMEKSSTNEEAAKKGIVKDDNIIETLTSDIEIKVRKPRGNLASLLITAGLVFGPISLILSLLTGLFNFLPNSTFIFSIISVAFLISSIISAKSIQ